MKTPASNILTLDPPSGFAERSIVMSDMPEDDAETGTNEESANTSETGDPLKKPIIPDPDPIGPRPDGSTERQIYVLLVGINDYPAGITDLRGCIKDLDQVEQYLLSREDKDNIHILRLEDKNATYNNIISGFKDHLTKAQANDVAWFHFSGHGSEELTATEFLPFAPNGKDQTMVTYWESEADGHRHIADKEMAWLIKEVATIDEMRNAKLGSPSIIVSQDCCHSGGGTRDMDEVIKSRMHPLSGDQKRDIKSYYGDYHTQAEINVPIAPHIALAGCESVQVAGDMLAGGIFTTNLITTLSQDSEVNYTDLFTRTRAQVKRVGAEQTPQFETIGGFNPYTKFLSDETIGSQVLYDLEASEKADPLTLQMTTTWHVKCGAIHGLPAQSEKPILISIQNQAKESIGQAKLTGIGAQKSSFQFQKLDAASGTMVADESISLDPAENYQAVLLSLPAAPALVWLEGSDSDKAAFIKAWNASDKTIPRNILLADDKASAGLMINTIGRNYELVDLKKNQILQSIAKTDDNPEDFLIFDLSKVVNWERNLKLSNPNSNIKSCLDFRMELIDHKPEALVLREKDPQTELDKQEAEAVSITEFLDFSRHKIEFDPTKFKVGNGMVGSRMRPVLTFNRVTQDLYCYLLHFQDDYAIQSYEGEVVFRPEEHNDTSKVEQLLWSNTNRAIGLSIKNPTSTSIFKLLVTTERLDIKHFIQASIRGDRNIFMFEDDNKISDDWCCFTINLDIALPQHIIAQAQQS
ncbi:MAG: caspase family protein [Bacteroidia bacterium]